MSAALPILDTGCCLPDCADVLVQNIPGPTGTDGTDGTAGEDGVSAVTTLTVAFTMPAELASDTATVVSTAGFTIGETVYVQGLGTLQVTAIASATGMTLKNLEDAATFAYASNAAPTVSVAAIGSRISPTGMQGPAGLLTGTAGGDIKGTYPNLVKLAIPNALGALAVGNGTDAVSLSMGVAGYLLVNDPTTFPATGIGHKRVTPIAGDTNAIADRLTRLSSAAGVPIPIEVARASLKDPGGLGLFVADETTGNARGTDAVDLQVNRPAAGVTAVASGNQAVISGGQDNTASGTRSVVGGGENNLASGQESVIGGGDSNRVDSTQASVVGGDTNTILGGAASASFIGGGTLNAITGSGQAVIGGGSSNAVSSLYGAILGGATNTASASFATIAGGTQAVADKYGQRAFSSGRFSTGGDCQQSDLIWRISTTTNTANVEAFLDGSGQRAVVPNNKTWAFEILCVGRSDAGVSAAWSVKGAIQNNAGVTALVGLGVTEALLGDGSGGTWGAVGNAPLVDADNANDALRIRVTGAITTNIRWTMHARIMEVAY